MTEKTDYRIKDVHNQASRHQREIDNCVKLDKFGTMDLEVKSLKNSLEMELDAIQGHVRESKDKCAMLIKKMDTFNWDDGA